MIRLKDGETSLLAGLLKDDRKRTSSTGLPWLSDLPVIGALFGDNLQAGQPDRPRPHPDAAHHPQPRHHRGGPRAAVGRDREPGHDLRQLAAGALGGGVEPPRRSRRPRRGSERPAPGELGRGAPGARSPGSTRRHCAAIAAADPAPRHRNGPGSSRTDRSRASPPTARRPARARPRTHGSPQSVTASAPGRDGTSAGERTPAALPTLTFYPARLPVVVGNEGVSSASSSTPARPG